MFTLSTVLAAILTAPAADAKTELAKWQGTWEVELQLIDGREKPAKDRNVEKLIVKDDLWEIHFKGGTEPVKGKLKLVLDGGVKGMDVIVGDAVYRSIYLLDGDRVVVRVGDAGDPRPKDFSTSGGTKTGAIMIYRRTK